MPRRSLPFNDFLSFILPFTSIVEAHGDEGEVNEGNDDGEGNKATIEVTMKEKVPKWSRWSPRGTIPWNEEKSGNEDIMNSGEVDAFKVEMGKMESSTLRSHILLQWPVKAALRSQ
ncbi:hypothetical protein Cni_G09583 [Canna indica]|uniref:Uncharacterized protein n=1 Tax=Canna indica TaxID=4628 RepID=A0AAQ3Q9S8_9LILI|nr:hypothetical protein Cni_G09583 [Canna indica]